MAESYRSCAHYYCERKLGDCREQRGLTVLGPLQGGRPELRNSGGVTPARGNDLSHGRYSRRPLRPILPLNPAHIPRSYELAMHGEGARERLRRVAVLDDFSVFEQSQAAARLIQHPVPIRRKSWRRLSSLLSRDSSRLFLSRWTMDNRPRVPPVRPALDCFQCTP